MHKATGIQVYKPVLYYNFEDLQKMTALKFGFNNHYSTIKANSFRDFKNIESLEIFLDEIDTFEPSCFKGLNRLTTLTLHCSDLNKLAHNLFDDMTNLEMLKLVKCRMPSYAFLLSAMCKKLCKLKTIKFYICKVEKDDKKWKDEHLKRKNLYLHLKNATEMRVKKSFLPYIDENHFYGLDQLRKISLTRNRLSHIDLNGLNGLAQLETLSIDHNDLKMIDFQCFVKSPKLNSLCLGSNKIHLLQNNSPKNGSFMHLEHINLSGNQFIQLNLDSFQNMTSLRELNFSCNQINCIEDSFQNMTSLRELNFSCNQINCIEDDAFAPLVNLTHLDLGFNRLTKIRSNSFKGLRRLKFLDLSQNGMKHIETNSFEDLLELKILDLTYNDLTCLNLSLLNKLVRLEDVRLSGNDLNSKTTCAIETLAKKNANVFNLVDPLI